MGRVNAITKVSEITAADIVEYARIPEPDEGDLQTVENFLAYAKSYMAGYTGHTIEELDGYPDLVPVTMVLCQDLWDNRGLYQESPKANLNLMVEHALSLHSVNLL